MRDFRSLYVQWGGRRRFLFETQVGDWGRDVRIGVFGYLFTLSRRRTRDRSD